MLLCGLLPSAAAAHPHVFVDVSLTLRYDAGGRLSSIDEIWAYDELYSLLILSEVGNPGQGGFDADQMRALDRLDSNWDPRNGGRLTLDSSAGPVAVAAPRHLSTALEGNRMVTRRRHALAVPVAGDLPVSLRVYDPTYYVAFSMPSQVVIQGRAGCRAALQTGNPQVQGDAYASALRDALARELGRTDSQVQVDIGALGADSIRVTCAD